MAKKIANEIATGITSGAVSGAVGGAGDGLLNNKNPLISGLQGLMGGAALGGATGFGTGKLLKYFDRKNLYKTKAPEDISKKYYSDYGEDSLNPREVISDIRSAKIDGGDARKATSDIQFDGIIDDDSVFPLSQADQEFIRSELNTNLSKSERKQRFIKRWIGDYEFVIENKGFDDYRIIRMEKINNDKQFVEKKKNGNRKERREREKQRLSNVYPCPSKSTF